MNMYPESIWWYKKEKAKNNIQGEEFPQVWYK